jgi:acyl-CoA synthetase (AMP-forming)/AMP-acid ligase II
LGRVAAERRIEVLVNIAEFLSISAASVPDRLAVVDAERQVSYAQLESRVDRLAQSLWNLGVGPGHAIGVLSVNSLEMIELLYASAAVGATYVPINYRAKRDELAYMANAADVSVLFVSERYWSLYQEIAHLIPSVEYAFTIGHEVEGHQSIEVLRKAPKDVPVTVAIGEDDPALIIYTSGTTSRPKGVVLSFRSLTALVVNTQRPADPALDQEVLLVSVGFYHIAGATTMMSAIFSGRQLVIQPAFDPEGWLDLVEQRGVTHAFVVPTMLKRILETPGIEERDLSKLQLITYGAAPMPYEVVRHAVDVFGPHAHDVGLMNAYGQTEATGSMTFLGPDDHKLDGTPEENEAKLHRLRSVGRPMPDVDIGILAPDGRSLPAGEDGEICIRGDRVMKRYNKREDDTTEALADGWLHTGDVGHLDDDGYLFITGRIKDMIIRGGENIAPAEIEQVLEDHPAVAEAAVIGVPDNEWGEVVVAFLVAPRGVEATPDELTEYVKSRLASNKVPSTWLWVDELPRNHMGKILKTELAERLASTPLRAPGGHAPRVQR